MSRSHPVTRDELDYRYRQRQRSRAARGRKIVHELLAAYWVTGDGEDPPEFIKRAMRYCGYTAAPISIKGKGRAKKETFLPGKVRL